MGAPPHSHHDGCTVSGNSVLDLRNEGVGHQAKVYDAAGKDAVYGNNWDGTLTAVREESFGLDEDFDESKKPTGWLGCGRL